MKPVLDAPFSADITHPPGGFVRVHKHSGEFTGASLTSTTTTAQAGI